MTRRSEELERRISDKQGSLEIVYEESDEELRESLNNFDKEMELKSEALFQLKRSVEGITELFYFYFNAN